MKVIAWTIEHVVGLHINISNYEPLSESSYIPLPKVLISLKNKDHKCFMWCHVRMLNPQNRNAERINKQDKTIAANLNIQTLCFR